MCHKFKRIRVISATVVLALALAITASAATWHSWGPQYFTPYTGTMGAFDDGVKASDMMWSSDDITSIKNAGGVGFKTLEFECRPYSNNPGSETTSVDPNNIWYNNDNQISFMSNYPSAYYEFQSNDPDDVAICVGRAADLVAETSYYGTLSLELKPGITTANRRVLLESEFGRQLVVGDSIPTDYEQVFNRSSDSDVEAADTYFEKTYEW